MARSITSSARRVSTHPVLTAFRRYSLLVIFAAGGTSMLEGNVFVFDNVVHMYDLSDDNLKRPDSALDRHWHLTIGVTRRPKGQDKAYGITDGYAAYTKRWNAADLGKMLFQESSTDMAMAQPVPRFDA